MPVRMTAKSFGFMNPDLEECLSFINKHFGMSPQEAALHHGEEVMEKLGSLTDRAGYYWTLRITSVEPDE